MSRYSKLLTKIIAESGYTAKEIVDKCNKIGNGIDTTRLSKLQNCKLPAPSEKVSRDIARICKADERLLVIEGYLEKAPKEIMDMLVSIKLMTMMFTVSAIDNKVNSETSEEVKEALNKEPIADFIISILDQENSMEINNDMLEFKATEKDFTFILKEAIALTVKDNGMFPKILEGAKIKFRIQNEYENGDILAIRLKNGDLIARYAFFNNDIITLIPLNSEYEITTYNLNDIVILGKVTKTIIDI